MPAPTKPAKRLTAILATLVAVLLVIGPAYVTAATDFQDVDNANIFAEDIAWMADSGVTRGCSSNPPLFCPDDFVTREQMAAFMRRLAENQVVNADMVDGLHADELGSAGDLPRAASAELETPKSNLATERLIFAWITAPADGFLAVHGSVQFTNLSEAVFALCALDVDDTTGDGDGFTATFRLADLSTAIAAPCATDGLFQVTAGTHNVVLEVATSIDPDKTTTFDAASLVVTFVPLDGNGAAPDVALSGADRSSLHAALTGKVASK